MLNLAESIKKNETATIERSTKTVADVAKALIVALHVDGGISVTFECEQVFFPDENWSSIERCRKDLVPNTSTGQLQSRDDRKAFGLYVLQQVGTSRSHRSRILLESTVIYNSSVRSTVIPWRIGGLCCLDAPLRSLSRAAHDVMQLICLTGVNDRLVCFLCLDFCSRGR